MDSVAGYDGARLRVDSITGVPLELPIAGPGGRSFAFIIDFHIRLLAALAWYFGFMLLWPILVNSFGFDPDSWQIAAGLPALLIYFLYHPILEVTMGGRTPGKRMTGIRIVTTDGSAPGTGALILRNVFRFVDGLPAFYVVGLVTTIVNDRNQRVGDLAAGTLLIYDEAGQKVGLDDLTNAGAAKGISTAHAELIQDVLDRWPTLDPEDRLDLARRLVGRFDPDGNATQVASLNDESALRALQNLLGGLR